MSREGQPDKAPVPNDALAARMREKGFSETRLATAAGVDIKTVGRWVRGESLPQAVNAHAAADALGCDPQALWPDLFPIMRPPGTGTVAVSVYGSRADVPVTVWTELFGGALEAIDILVYGGTFLFDGVPRFRKLLTAATERAFSLCFTTRLVGGNLIDSESTDIAWTDPQDIPALTMHPSMRLRIQHYLEHRTTPYLG